jgi:hypothetical protein
MRRKEGVNMTALTYEKATLVDKLLYHLKVIEQNTAAPLPRLYNQLDYKISCVNDQARAAIRLIEENSQP